MSTRITAPVPGLDKVGVGGLTFVDSVAVTDNLALIAYCERAGYLVEADAKPGPDGAPDESWTVPQLTEWAKAHDVDLAGATRKADVLAAITDPDNPKTIEPGEALPVIPADPQVEQANLDPAE